MMKLPAMMALVSLLLAGLSHAGSDESGADAAVATMGSTRLSAAELRALVTALDADSRAALQANRSLLEQLVRQELVRRAAIQRAKEAKLDRDPMVQTAMTRAADQVLLAAYTARQVDPGPSYPSTAEVKSFFDANRERFRKPDRYHLAQIFLADTQPKVAQEAMRLYRKLAESPKKFGEMARTLSQHAESAARDGDLGWVEEGTVLPTLMPLLRSMKPGDIAPPVATAAGWHIMRLIESETGRHPSLSEADKAIRALLRDERMRRGEQEWAEKMVRDTPPQLHWDQLKLE
ncbi:MAG: peptidylprolyl isomerase [Magnetococcales bacterium]|nr:peptidylprolyl isomerase [Magnetococcales bacterium]